MVDDRYENEGPIDRDTPVDSETPVEKLIGGPNREVEVSTGKLTEVPSVKVPVVGRGVLEGERLAHQITPSLVSLQEVAVTNFVLVTTDTENDGVTVITTRLVTTMVVEFHSPEDTGMEELAGLLDSGIPVDDGIPVAGKDDVGGGESSLKMLLATGGEYGGGGA